MKFASFVAAGFVSFGTSLLSGSQAFAQVEPIEPLSLSAIRSLSVPPPVVGTYTTVHRVRGLEGCCIGPGDTCLGGEPLRPIIRRMESVARVAELVVDIQRNGFRTNEELAGLDLSESTYRYAPRRFEIEGSHERFCAAWVNTHVRSVGIPAFVAVACRMVDGDCPPAPACASAAAPSLPGVPPGGPSDGSSGSEGSTAGGAS